MKRGHPGLYDALQLAISHADQLPTSYLEIGVSDGASLLTVLNHAPIENLVLCDLWEPVEGGSGRGSHDHIAALLKNLMYEGHVLYLDGNSHILLQTLEPSFQFDLITVDGDHTFDGATADLEHVWPHLRAGGTLVFDDLTRGQLTRVWTEFSERHPTLHRLFQLDDYADVTVVARRTE